MSLDEKVNDIKEGIKEIKEGQKEIVKLQISVGGMNQKITSLENDKKKLEDIVSGTSNSPGLQTQMTEIKTGVSLFKWIATTGPIALIVKLIETYMAKP